MNQERRVQTLVGLPATGKTTFLAALGHVVDTNRDGLGCPLVVHELATERRYVNEITNRWRRCEDFPRTLLGAEHTVRLALRGADTGRLVTLRLPDLSGEMFRDQWEQRTCPTDYVDLVRNSQGILLFVHPNATERHTRLLECHNMPGLPRTGETAGKSDSDAELSWDPSLAPTAVQLVELLQFAARIIQPRRQLPVALIVSAWDLVRDQVESPESLLGQWLPMFDQYLRANAGLFATRIFGVSALGGDLREGGASRLASFDRPSERIAVHEPGVDTNDITAPIRWIMTTADCNDD